MISSVIKLHFTRKSSKTKYYRDGHKCDIDYFSSELSCQFYSTFCSIKENEELNQFNRFHRTFLNLLNIQAPLNIKILRESNSPFLTKTLRKAIMINSRLKNVLIKPDLAKTGHSTKHKGIFARNC